mmetsp:Transcript_4377/g.9458  ORF Transcript_4377/g.9458 Transcript_4377/m.9458 type:complete len:106 (-) Transcript_4377:480-797(-)
MQTGAPKSSQCSSLQMVFPMLQSPEAIIVSHDHRAPRKYQPIAKHKVRKSVSLSDKIMTQCQIASMAAQVSVNLTTETSRGRGRGTSSSASFLIFASVGDTLRER